jgi:LDH2 family malate/lactate/ureidoglycolate dehydrogenase
MHEHISTAVVNGDNGMGHLVMKRAAEIAIEKARTSGIAWVAIQQPCRPSLALRHHAARP